MTIDTSTLSGPPDFEHARNKRQKVRGAGLDPNYWYAAAESRELGREQIREVVFWKMSVAIYRDRYGQVHAVENRCAHRQLKLSLGSVHKDKLVCAYHGWKYDAGGK